MPLAVNDKTGKVLIYMEREFVSKEEAKKMCPDKRLTDFEKSSTLGALIDEFVKKESASQDP